MRKDVRLEYEGAEYPVKIIVSKEFLDKYNKVFHFLL